MKNKGFSLIEVAIVLFIAAIVGTSMLSAFVSLAKSNEYGYLRGLMDTAKGDLLLSTAKTKVCGADCSYTVTVPGTAHMDVWGTALEFTILAGPVIDKNTANVPMVRIWSLGPDHAVGGQDDVTVYVTTAELVYLLSRSGL